MAGGRRAAEALLAHAGPVHRAHSGGAGEQDHPRRDWNLPPDRARSNPRRQAGCERRPRPQRPLHLRHRRRVEPGRDGESRHGLQHALEAHAREGGGDQGHLDRRSRRVPRRHGRLRAAVVLAETRPEATPTDRAGRKRTEDPRARRALRRWMDAQPRRGARTHPRAAADGERRGSATDPGHLLPEGCGRRDRAMCERRHRSMHLVCAPGQPRRCAAQARGARRAGPSLPEGLAADIETPPHRMGRWREAPEGLAVGYSVAIASKLSTYRGTSSTECWTESIQVVEETYAYGTR